MKSENENDHNEGVEEDHPPINPFNEDLSKNEYDHIQSIPINSSPGLTKDQMTIVKLEGKIITMRENELKNKIESLKSENLQLRTEIDEANEPIKSTNGLAISSIIISIIGLLLVVSPVFQDASLILSVVSLLLGFYGITSSDRKGTGLITAIIGSLISILVMIIIFNPDLNNRVTGSYSKSSGLYSLIGNDSK